MNDMTRQDPHFPINLLHRCLSRARRGFVAAGAALLLLLGASAPLHAETAGQALRSYLNARLQGDVETARGLWERLEMRRALAMGMQYEGVEASWDPYWLMSREERGQFAAEHQLVVMDSVVENAVAHFTVAVQSHNKAVAAPTWRYLVEKTESGWRVALPLMHDTRSWTRREGRYVAVRSKRLSRVNSDALHAMDAHIDSLFTLLHTPKAAQLRLERVKFEIFLADEPADLETLLGSRGRAGLLVSGERIVTLEVADFAALTTAVANLTLRKTPPSGAPFFEQGLALACGGEGELSSKVSLQRLRNRVLRDELQLDAAFAPGDDEPTRGARALWNHVLLDLLGSDAYMKLYASERGTPQAMHHLDPKSVRPRIEKATGKKGAKLDQAILEQLRAMQGDVQSGCDAWPADVRNLRPLLNWRDQETTWSMRGYDVGQEYVFGVGAFRNGLSSWEIAYVDSIAKAAGREGIQLEQEPEPERPAGDPPYMMVMFSPRYELEPEPYVSRLYEKLFSSREYGNELLGFFVTYDLIRVYDFRTDRIIAEYAVDTAAPGDPTLYDEEAGRMCFRIRKSVFGKPFTDFTPRAGRYTGE